MTILPPPSISDSDIRRFNDKIHKFEGGCWVWTGTSRPAGYGVFKFGSQRYMAHRISFLIHHGYHPRGLVCHHCDNPSCVNPEHLYDGDHLTNTRDMIMRGRVRGQVPAFVPPSEPDNPYVRKIDIKRINKKTRLTETEVQEISRRIEARRASTNINLAKEYGVSVSVIATISHNTKPSS